MKKKKARINLEHAFLNTGLVEEYGFFIIKEKKNNYDSFLLPIYAKTIESIHNLKVANDFFLNKDWDKFSQQIESSDKKSISHLFKSAFLIKKYWTTHQNDQNDQNFPEDLIYNANENELDDEKISILKEIELGFDALSSEIGTNFSHDTESSYQTIVNGQQLIELQEMFLSNDQRNNFIKRFSNLQQISSFLYQILLLRIAVKGENLKDNFIEKVSLFALCRKSCELNLMNKYLDFFFPKNTPVPIEIQYEVLLCKLANNKAKEEDFDIIMQNVLSSNEQKSKFGPEYDLNNLKDQINYHKASFYARSFNEYTIFKKVVSLCEKLETADAINLWSWANLNLFRIQEEKILNS